MGTEVLAVPHAWMLPSHKADMEKPFFSQVSVDLSLVKTALSLASHQINTIFLRTIRRIWSTT